MADKTDGTEKAERRHPANIPKMTEHKDPATVQQMIRATYGFDVSEQFANDFVAFVEKMTRGA